MAGDELSAGMLNSYSSHDAEENRNKRKLHLLVAASGPRETSWAEALVVRLSKHPFIEMRAITDYVVPRLTQTILVMQNSRWRPGRGGESTDGTENTDQQALEPVEWADMMMCVPIDADSIAKMLANVCENLLGRVLRGWHTHKSIVMVPGMSADMWSSPLTKSHLDKIQREWKWIRVMTPVLWHLERPGGSKLVSKWDGFGQVLRIVNTQAELIAITRDPEVAPPSTTVGGSDLVVSVKLPSEIWTIILEYTGDWELAQALGVWTNLPLPPLWMLKPKDPEDPLQAFTHDLEWTFLRGNGAAICKKLSEAPPSFQDLSALMVKLTIRLCHTDVLTYLEAHRPELMGAFAGDVLPRYASGCYPRIQVLDYWKHSKWFTDDRRYGPETMDGASRNGHVQILDWWLRSGLPLRYTDSAMGQATINGHLSVLEWWKAAAAQDVRVVLRPGDGLLLAAHHGRADMLQWWASSGVPAGSVEGLAWSASSRGHVQVLETWRRLKGAESLVYDDDVLLSPTLLRHIHVLEWWRRLAHGELQDMNGHGRPVGYCPADIEGAIRAGNTSETAVRHWWVQHGLLPGLGGEEGHEVRYL